MPVTSRRIFVLGLLTSSFLTRAALAASPDIIPASARLEPAALAKMLPAARPAILHVGFKTLFDQAHIPGSIFAGPGNRDDGLKSLSDKSAALPRGELVVLYCGCCPWTKCPNMDTAWQQLRTMGFNNVKALYIPENFGADWVDKGYPVESSS